MTGERSCKSPGRHASAMVVALGLLLTIGWEATLTGGQAEKTIEITQTKLLSEQGSTRATRPANRIG